MTTRSLIRILLLLAVGWLLLLGPGLLTHWSILRQAGGYRRAEFLVTGGHCVGGGSGGRTQRSAPRCFLEGKVLLDGGRTSSDEELVGSAHTSCWRPHRRLLQSGTACRRPPEPPLRLLEAKTA
jgi:hypothetical protein